MGRTRARLLAGTVVIATATVACSLDLEVADRTYALAPAPGSDDGGVAGGFDAASGPGSDAGGEAGLDAASGPGSDAGMMPDADAASGPGSDGGMMPDADAGSDAGSDGGMMPDADAGSDAGSDGGMMPDADAGSDAGSDGGMMPDADAGSDAGSDAGGGSAAVDVTPTSLDFGEVRIDTPPPSFTIMVTNRATSSAAAQITSFDLREHRMGLVLDAPTTPLSIAPGASQTAMLTLETAEDTILDGEYVDIIVDGATVELPVTGRVVTPSSRVVPEELDLGTACVGTQVSGNVMLINDGTATLAVDPPQMDQSFVASSPGTPLALPPTMSITATVSPAMNAAGLLAGTMTWHDDVPSDYEIPVMLEYVVSGTALSPRGLDFGSVEVDDPAPSQSLKLQNCDLDPSSIKIESLQTKPGTLGAWVIDPHVGYTKQLASHEEQAVTVTFQPPARGRYEAELTLRTIDGRQVVHLVGDATGRDFERTSFYACACNAPGPPVRGWPIVVAIAIVISRRRRAASSAR
jgi:hypothetical protein